ncbi:hypothetical protein HK101_007813 [Irineochytrium annulatum]|nr:hypothetical protein HK101_007813 [Irineochytrium annulatum]
MAEAYWCHACEDEVEIDPAPDGGGPMCPECGGEFVEKLEAVEGGADDPRLLLRDDDDEQERDDEDEDGEPYDEEDGEEEGSEGDAAGAGAGGGGSPQRSRRRRHRRAAAEDPREALAHMLAAVMRRAFVSNTGAPNAGESPGGADGDGGLGAGGNGNGNNAGPNNRMGTGGFVFAGGLPPLLLDIPGDSVTVEGNIGGPNGGPPSPGGAAADGVSSGNPHQTGINLMELMQNLLMSSGAFQGGDMRSLFNMHGNPGDYVFGQQNLDAIITQLMESNGQQSGPPPASDHTIANLQKVIVKGSQLGEHSECPICQEDFTEEGDGEVAVKLTCAHYFHPTCIENWLKVNGTCPVCRKEVEEMPSYEEVD